MSKKELSEKLFIKWVKKNNPVLYRAALAQNNNTLNGDEEASNSNWFDKITDTISNLAPKYLQYKQQKKVMSMQIKRAKSGLPPANVADYAPVIKTQIDLAPETRAELIKGGQASLNDFAKPLLIGGGLLAAFLMLKK